MKKFTIIGSVLLAVVLIVGFVVYAGGEDKPKAKSTDVAAQKAEKCDLEEGSAACQERHAKGECTGHELEQLQQMEDCDHSCSRYKECSAKHVEKNAKGECTGHKQEQTPGQYEKQKKQ